MAMAAVKQNTNGAAAYDLYRYSSAAPKMPPVQTQEPQIQTRTRTQSAPAGNPVMNALFLMAALMGMILIIFSNARLNESGNAVAALQSRLSTLQEEQARLQSEYEKSVDLAAIETKATTELGMSRPVSGQTVYLSLSGEDRGEVLNVKNGFFGRAANSVSEAFSSLGEYLS